MTRLSSSWGTAAVSRGGAGAGAPGTSSRDAVSHTSFCCRQAAHHGTPVSRTAVHSSAGQKPAGPHGPTWVWAYAHSAVPTALKRPAVARPPVASSTRGAPSLSRRRSCMPGSRRTPPRVPAEILERRTRATAAAGTQSRPASQAAETTRSRVCTAARARRAWSSSSRWSTPWEGAWARCRSCSSSRTTARAKDSSTQVPAHMCRVGVFHRSGAGPGGLGAGTVGVRSVVAGRCSMWPPCCVSGRGVSRTTRSYDRWVRAWGARWMATGGAGPGPARRPSGAPGAL